jgi:hypothetical protein
VGRVHAWLPTQFFQDGLLQLFVVRHDLFLSYVQNKLQVALRPLFQRFGLSKIRVALTEISANVIQMIARYTIEPTQNQKQHVACHGPRVETEN